MPEPTTPNDRKRRWAGRGLGVLWRWGKGKHDQRKLLAKVSETVHKHIAITALTGLAVGAAGAVVGTVGMVQANTAVERLDQTETAAGDISDTVDTLTERVEMLTTEATVLATALSDGDEETARQAASHTAAVAAEVAGLSVVVAGQADALQQVTDQHDSLIGTLAARVDDIDATLTDLALDVADQADLLDELTGRTDSLLVQLQQAGDRLDTAEHGLAAAQTTLGQLTARVEALEDRPQRMVATHTFTQSGELDIDVPAGRYVITASVLYSHPGGQDCRVNATLSVDGNEIRTVGSESQVPTTSAAIPILEIVDLEDGDHTVAITTQPQCDTASVGTGAIVIATGS